MSEENDVIQVVLAVYDPLGTYSRYAGIVVTSIFSNTQSKVHVTILHDTTLTDDNRRRFERTAERWKQSVSFIDVSEQILCIGAYLGKVPTTLSRGALFRLLTPKLLSVPKVIYLDCDIVVNLDLAELWTMPIGDFSLATVKDPWVPYYGPNERIRSRIMHYVPEEYFNSGVLLMNLQRIREKYDLVRDAHRFFTRYVHVATYVDQDCLNALFVKDVVFMDERFNRMLPMLPNDPNLNNSIIHFTGLKPWKVPENSDRAHLFWRTFSESEWSDQIVDTLLEAFKDQSLALYRSRDCVKLLLRRIPQHLRLDRFYKGLVILIKELALRIKIK
jgi:lipopolysaccharide biosynthesis glycosyltransferase